MNTQEELLTAILAELRKMNGVKEDVAPIVAPQQESKRWMPECDERYGFVDICGVWIIWTWSNHRLDIHRHAIGNCYRDTERERAIWEQVTRRKYEAALWDAADWETGGAYQAQWLNGVIITRIYSENQKNGLPRFKTDKSAIEAHTRILGDDAQRYFKGRVWTL
jgi:hypothetical protein